MMPHTIGFQYRGPELFCEDVPVSVIAQEVGTPCYLYSYAGLEAPFRAYDQALAGLPHLICFSAKANANLAVLRTFVNLGGGVDVVSYGELYRARQAGAEPRKIVYAGVGKTDWEIAQALKEDILLFNAESPQELRRIDEVAGRVGRRARVALRVNPDVDPRTHPYIATGMKQSKFGIDIRRALEEYHLAAQLPHLEVIGVDCHIGSQLTELDPFLEAFGKVRELIKLVRDEGITIEYLDVGGGLGIRYLDEAPPRPEEYGEAVRGLVEGLGCTLILEPGRSLVGSAGVLLTRVLYTKETEAKSFVIVDAAMNDLLRPTLYGAHHEIVPVRKGRRETKVVSVVGPVCESGDFLANDRQLPVVQPGDLLAVLSAGAYGFVMASNYNARPRAAEVMVREERFAVVRSRETYEDLVRGEALPSFLQ